MELSDFRIELLNLDLSHCANLNSSHWLPELLRIDELERDFKRTDCASQVLHFQLLKRIVQLLPERELDFHRPGLPDIIPKRGPNSTVQLQSLSQLAELDRVPNLLQPPNCAIQP